MSAAIKRSTMTLPPAKDHAFSPKPAPGSALSRLPEDWETTTVEAGNAALRELLAERQAKKA